MYGCESLHLRYLHSALLLLLFTTLVATAAAIGGGGGIDCGNVNGHFLRHDARFVTDPLCVLAIVTPDT